MISSSPDKLFHKELSELYYTYLLQLRFVFYLDIVIIAVVIGTH